MLMVRRLCGPLSRFVAEGEKAPSVWKLYMSTILLALLYLAVCGVDWDSNFIPPSVLIHDIPIWSRNIKELGALSVDVHFRISLQLGPLKQLNHCFVI